MKEAVKIEHCDTPDCPECDRVAYERGKKDGAREERERIIEWTLINRRYSIKGTNPPYPAGYNDCLDDLINFLDNPTKE